jgi:phage recombination protein Bet
MSGKSEITSDVARVHVTPAPIELSKEQIQLLTDTIARGATSNELRLFIEVCRRMNLDPFSHQIYAIKRWDSVLKREVTTYQIGIDGFRLIASRTGLYEGQEGPYWCGSDGKWVDVWLDKVHPPWAAKVGVRRKGFVNPIYAVALYVEHVPLTKDGRPNSMWLKRPAGQTAKCAEAQALRKAFPAELSGIYASEEMEHADSPPAAEKALGEDLSEVPDAVKAMWLVMQQGGIKGACEVFGELKARLIKAMGPGGQTEYYRILREFGGVEHANAFRGHKAAQKASRAMWAAIGQAEALRQPVEDEPAAETEEREPGLGE